MKSWKKQLNDEFERAVPALKPEILDAPIVVGGDMPAGGNTLVKRRVGIISACVAVICALVIAILAIAGVFNPAVPPVSGDFVFTLEINPAVAFVTDGEGKVKAVTALNGDADVVLAEVSPENMKNIPISEAVVKYTDGAAKLGYLDPAARGGAVRLSGKEGEDTLLSSAELSLGKYFCDKGIYAVVVKDFVSESELIKRTGISGAGSLAELSKTLSSVPSECNARVPSDLGAEQIKALYDSYIVGESMLELVRGELLDNIAKIVQNSQMLLNIVSLNGRIMSHSGNPSQLFKDYWSVKMFGGESDDGEFNALMDEMTAALEEYETTFGEAIGSYSALSSAAGAYSSLLGQDFKEVISSLTSDDFLSSVSDYIKILSNIGGDMSAVTSLTEIPQTAEEYIRLAETATSLLRNSRVEKYLAVYSESRPEISEESYGEFVEGIVALYGSLDNYWNLK